MGYTGLSGHIYSCDWSSIVITMQKTTMFTHSQYLRKGVTGPLHVNAYKEERGK